MAITTSITDSPSTHTVDGLRRTHRAPAPVWGPHVRFAAIAAVTSRLVWLARFWQVEVRGWHLFALMSVVVVLFGANLLQAVTR